MLPEEQKLPLARNLGDALAVIAKHLWPHHTAKRAETDWDIDRLTAKNVVKGVTGAAVVTKAVRARQLKHDDAWDLWLAIGRLVIGESLQEYQERKLQAAIENTNNAVRLHQESLALSRALDDRAAKLVALDDRVAS